MNKTMTITENETLTRVGDRKSFQITDKETNFTKRIYGTEKQVCKLYNSKSELMGIDIVPVKENTETVIYNKNKGLTIVIVERDDKKYKGISRCNEDDYFSPQIGYRVAKYRALIKMYEDKLKEYMEG